MRNTNKNLGAKKIGLKIFGAQKYFKIILLFVLCRNKKYGS